ncbi:telomere silencing protein Zds1 [Blastomyces dermatitidis ER-3]|uniref:Telomere silencing protein Zds1 n=1 Tax=Ajellomyces dermatitidis (strain ER-3 / ATCC MYA-2586) TaxID=559297 RepID=A0ABX2VZN0_AJEDR|nr:telomere silencing protein Zds1 [Blastomyces dermatitidis ER-3]OAT02585.1 telomere silencing protein Zds1 [Blastomyces dermatitidis ER-3]
MMQADICPSSQTSTSPPYDHSGGYSARRGRASQLSISDDSQHVTETIGYMYGDDYDKRDSKRLSFTPSSMNESLSVTSPRRQNLPQPSDSNNYQRPLPLRTSSIDRSASNDSDRQSAAEPGSSDRDGTGPCSQVLTRSPSTTTSISIPLNDIDYESNPAAAVAQELSNLAALRRMSMDVGAADPDLPLFGSNFGIPPIPPSGESDDDASQLFWVPARLHPGLAPKEFKSFLDGKAEQIKRRSGELTMTDSELQVQGLTGGLRRKKSMLSRQIDTSGSGGQNEGNQLDSVSEEVSVGQRRAKDSMVDDRPILPPAPPGHSLRRSTRTTYRRGSLKTGDRIPYSRRAPRQSDPDAEAVARRSPPLGEEEPPILGLTRVATDPTHGGTSGFSRPTNWSPASSATNNLSISSGESNSDPLTSGNRTASTPPSQTRSSWDLNDRSNLEPSAATQNVHQIIQTPPADVKESPATATASTPNHIPVRKSSHDPPPSQPPQAPLPPEPIGKRSSKRAGIIRPAKESSQTINDIASRPAALPGNSTRTDTLSFIPTLTDSSNKKSDSKKSKDKKDGEGGRKSSWTWRRGSEEKDKDKKKEDESKRSKGRMPKIAEKVHDNTRLDLLQASIDGAQTGRESVVIDRAEVRLEEERRKDTAKRGAGNESKKEKEPSLFSSIFGGKKKGNLDYSQKKHSSRTLSPEPQPRELKPDIDYNWTRFPISKEREIYRYAHWKLAEPKRALHSQVLLSNFMYSYLAKVQQMHPTLSISSAPQAQHRKREHSQSEDHSQHQRHQSREHDNYNNGSYYNESHYDYDSDDRDDHHWSQSGGRGTSSQNGSAHGSNQRQQYGASRSSFGDEAQLDDDDDMW